MSSALNKINITYTQALQEKKVFPTIPRLQWLHPDYIEKPKNVGHFLVQVISQLATVFILMKTKNNVVTHRPL